MPFQQKFLFYLFRFNEKIFSSKILYLDSKMTQIPFTTESDSIIFFF